MWVCRGRNMTTFPFNWLKWCESIFCALCSGKAHGRPSDWSKRGKISIKANRLASKSSYLHLNNFDHRPLTPFDLVSSELRLRWTSDSDSFIYWSKDSQKVNWTVGRSEGGKCNAIPTTRKINFPSWKWPVVFLRSQRQKNYQRRTKLNAKKR